MKKQEVGGNCITREEIHNLYSSPNIIRMTKSRRMRRKGHVARMGRRGVYISYSCEIHKKRIFWNDKTYVGG
jgi:hypothetical protein